MSQSKLKNATDALKQGRLLELVQARTLALAGRMPMPQRVRWLGANSKAEAATSLVVWGRALAKVAVPPEPTSLILVGPSDTLQKQVAAGLADAKSRIHCVPVEFIEQFSVSDAAHCVGILCTSLDTHTQTLIARKLSAHAQLSTVRFEYVSGLDPAQKQFAELDEYADTWFVSPVLQDQPNPYEIYTESLQHFEQKCGLRDYLDLYQALADLVRRQVPGDIAEFGSYKGHSGWLIARSLQALGSDKRVWMFDMFESFPEEHLGVDQFWSSTHHVDFNQVQAKLSGFDNVVLVQGDFTQTLVESEVQQLALGYVDCDSYRATRYLLETLPDRYLSVGGLLICEDYGHPALLGNRVAVHEVMDKHKNFARYYSQFSGLCSFIKLQQ